MGLFDFLKGNAGALGTIGGGALGLLFGNPMLGASLGGALGGAAQAGGAAREAPRFDYSADLRGSEAYQRLSDPRYGLAAFQGLAASATPTLSDYLGMARARGGSFVQGQEQFEAARQAGQGQAYDAFRQFRLGADEQLLGAEGTARQLDAGQAAREAERRYGTGRDFLQEGAGLLGYLYGNGLFGGGQGGGGGAAALSGFRMPQLSYRPPSYPTRR